MMGWALWSEMSLTLMDTARRCGFVVKMVNIDPLCQVRDTLTEVLHKHGNGDAVRNNKIS